MSDDVEILDPEPVHVTALTRPFNFDRTELDVTGTYTIAELLAQAGIPAWLDTRVYLNGSLVKPAWYARVRPKPGTHVLVRVVPRGGDGGTANKVISALEIVIGVVLIIIGAMTTPVGWGLIAGGVLLIIGGLMNLLIPVPTVPKLRALSGLDTKSALSPALAIGGGRNALRAYGPVPRLLGRFQCFPPYGALPFTEEVGNDQYVRMLFVVGLGPCDIDEIKIGQTPIANYDGVELEVRTGAPGEPPITLYTSRIYEDPMSVTLTAASGAHVRTSQTGAKELAVTISFGTGLVGFDGYGSAYAISVTFRIQYRKVGQTTLRDAPFQPLTISDVREGLARGGLRWKPCNTGGLWGASYWTQLGLGGFDGAKVNNGNVADAAFNVNAAPLGSRLQLNLPDAREFGRVQVTTEPANANATWSVYYSDDAVDWTICYQGLQTGTGVSEAAWNAVGPHKYWLLYKTNDAVAGGWVYEVEWGEVAEGLVSDQYEVVVTRLTADATSPLIRDVATWTALRTYGADPAILLDGVATIALRIKATDQLSGIIDTLNCIATSRVLDFADYPSAVQADKPLGYWRLGEILGAPTAFDASGHGRSGTYAGAPTLGTTGLILVDDPGTAMGCDGVDDEVANFVGLTAIDMGAMSFSVEVVVSAFDLLSQRGIVHKGDGNEYWPTPHFGWALWQGGNSLGFCRASGASGYPTLITSLTIAADTTYHIVVTYDFATGIAVFWKNGVAVSTVNIGNTPYIDTYPLNIGGVNPQSSALRWKGRLQEVAVYPFKLTDARIQAHAAAALSGTHTWVEAPTSNPASLYRTVLQDRGNAKAVADARLDLPTLEAWHKECSAGGRSCNLVVDYAGTVGDVLRDIAAAGRATPTMNGTKFSVVRDVAQTTPVQHITPRNSRNFKGRRVLRDAVHALKVRFIDPEAGWQQSERIVYDDGYDETNATNFDVLEPVGVTDSDWAWRLGRYRLAANRCRPELYEVEMDISALACRRGDLVRVAYDVVEWGVAQGRIKSLAMSGANATGMTTDEWLPMDASHQYAARIVLADGTSVVANIVLNVGNQTTVVFETALAPPNVPEVGAIVLFGVRNLESVRCLVTQIRRGPDISAILTLCDESPQVLNADQGSVPAWDPQMTIGAGLIALQPPTPIVDAVVSDESVLTRNLDGTLQCRILLMLHYAATSNVTADYLEVRFRRSDATSPYDALAPLPPNSPRVSIVPVEESVAYDIRVRTVSNQGPTSEWVEILGYVVVGKTSAPPAPLNLRLENDRLVWDYPTAPLDFLGFQLRRAPGTSENWDAAFEMHAGFISQSSYILPTTIFGVWTFLIVAVDTSGNVSGTSTFMMDFGYAALHNVVESYDYEAGGFPGGYTNGSVIGGHLIADQNPTGFWTRDENRFWSADPTRLFWGGTYKEMSYIFTFNPGPGSAGARIIFDVEVVAAAWTLEWKVGAQDFAPFPGSLENIDEITYTFRLTTGADIIQGQIIGLVLYVDADDLVEDIANFAVHA